MSRLASSAAHPTRTRHVALVAMALACAAALAGLAGGALAASGGGTPSPGDGGTGPKNPYRGDGMWIWYVSRSSGGDPGRIARRAKRHGVETVYIKSSDAGNAWSQFTPGLVSFLHSRGLRVCAWQFVYGRHPSAEATRGAEAVAKGADCLVIDAESTYEGRYAAADTYVDRLRHQVGRGFPTALASFPYVDYHPGLPYSVFLGPGGGRFNLPQLYWHAIGVSVAEAYRHTFQFNRVYRRPIDPIGQTYANPPLREIKRFRRMALSYNLDGVSWWVWQDTDLAEWRTLGRDVSGISGVSRTRAYPLLHKGSRGDLVVWAQEHLRGTGDSVPVTGFYGRLTAGAVRRFQRSQGLTDDGMIGAATWRRLLDVAPKMVDWSSKRARRGKATVATGAPASASLPALRREIPPPSER